MTTTGRLVIGAGILAALAAAAFAATGSDALFRAIRNNDLAFLKSHVNPTNIEARDSHEATLLMYAAGFGSPEALELLLAAGADVNAKNAFDATALLWAARDPVKARMLIEHGANVNVQSKQGRTPLMVASRAQGSSGVIQLLLDKGADPRVKDKRADTPLLLASEIGDVRMMRLLIDHGAPVNVANHFGETPLMLAALGNSLEGVRLLLAKGADVKPAMTSYSTVRNGPIPLVGLTVLFFAAPYASPELIQTLLDAGAAVNVQDARGFTPLMLAVGSETQDVRVVRLLLKAGAKVNLSMGTGETALDWAEKYGNPAVLRALREAGAKSGFQYPVPRKPDVSTEISNRQRVEKSVALMQRSSGEFFTNGGCVGCHHQPMTALAVRAARDAGVRVDEAAARENLNVLRLQWASSREELLQSIDPGGGPDRISISLLALSAAGLAPDAITDNAVTEVAFSQRLDGSWGKLDVPGASRPPMFESIIGVTARAVRALQLYGIPARKDDFDRRIARARAWLLESKAVTGEEAAMRLLGLYWAGANKDQVAGAARALVDGQRSDGGWAGNPNLESDAFTTGEALYALHETASVPVTGQVYRRGLEYLRSTQYPDGSWYVRSRAPKFQPYFQSGFPFDHDQWISAAATAWASMALAAAVEPASAIRSETGSSR